LLGQWFEAHDMQNHFALHSLLVIGFLGCGEARPNPVGGAAGQGLQVSPDATVTAATYTLTGPNGFASAGTVPVGDSPDVPVTLSHLPVGQGYVLELSATASDGVIVCEGSTTFDVVDSNATNTPVVHLECAVPSGSADMQTTLNVCPVLDGLDASPLFVRLGGVSRSTVTAHDADNGPLALGYSWAVNGVKLPSQTAPALNFACTSLGEVTIATTVSDGDPSPACTVSSSVRVTCE
jgi:hypothetical protein